VRKPKLRELREAVKALIKGPYTTKFPRLPSIPPETYRGKMVFDAEECVGCGACREVCPAEAIEIIDEVKEGKGKRRLIRHFDDCIFCGQCHYECITGEGTRITQEYDLAVKDRREAVDILEKDLVICEICGGVITAVDHLRWLIKKLGPMIYANPTLALTSHRELSLAEEVPRTEVPIGRQDHIRILCPRCRRAVIFTEEWGK